MTPSKQKKIRFLHRTLGPRPEREIEKENVESSLNIMFQGRSLDLGSKRKMKKENTGLSLCHSKSTGRSLSPGPKREIEKDNIEFSLNISNLQAGH